MTVEEAIWSRVALLAPVTALAGTRVYLDKLPQSPVYPTVRVQLIDDPSRYHLRGVEGAHRARVQVDAYADEASGTDPYADVAVLADAINGNGLGVNATGLSGWIGTVGSDFTVLACFQVDRTRRYDPDELRVVTMSQDYFVTYRNG